MSFIISGGAVSPDSIPFAPPPHVPHDHGVPANGMPRA